MFRQTLSVTVLTASIIATPAIAQEKPTEAPTSADAVRDHPIRFDVVSIKPAGPNENFNFRTGADGYSLVMSLTDLVREAYFAMNMSDRDPVSGASGWANSELWHIEAKVAPEDVAFYQQHRPRYDDPPNSMGKLMLQSLLADRFHLVIHRVPAEMDGYALVLGKKGPRLTEAAPDEAQAPAGIPISGGGYLILSQPGEFPHHSFHEVTMSSFAVYLRGKGCAVVDRTGLTGRYDFTLNWLSSGPDERHVGAIERDDPDPLSHWDLGALGLRAERVKLPTEHIVIDHVERPSPN